MKWNLLKLNAIATENDILGRNEGEALWPERVTIKDLLETRNLLGPKNFASLYQQEPIDNENLLFDSSNFKYFNDTDINIQNSTSKFICVDPAISTNKNSDYTVIAVCAKNQENDLFIYHILRERIPVGFHHLKIISLAERYSVNEVYIESINFQKLIGKDLDQSKYLVKDLGAKLSKFERSVKLQYLLNQNKVYLRSNSSWIDDFLLELEEFPNGKHDDQVDTISYAANVEVEITSTGIFGTNYNPNKNKVIKGKFSRFY